MSRVGNLLYSLFLMISLAACAHSEDLVRDRKVSLEIVEPKVLVSISDVRVLRKEKGVEVVGSVKRTGLGIMRGHMDIAIVSSEGKVLRMTSTEYTPSFRKVYVRRRAVRPSSFSSQFPDNLSLGAIVRIAFHPETLDKSLNCGNNQALPSTLFSI